MPTIILLDVSLSMCKTVGADNTEVKQLANVGIGTLLDYFAQNAQLEQTSLIVFSSLWEMRHSFTRHHESIKNGIYDLELYDKSNVVNAVRGVLSLKLQDWIFHGPINIILITDGQHYYESTSHIINPDIPKTGDEFHDISLDDLRGQFDFPCRIQVVCLASSKDPALRHSIPFYRELISIVDSDIKEDCPIVSNSDVKNLKQSAIWLPNTDDADMSVKLVEDLFLRLAEYHYKPYHVNLSCGHLSSLVMLSPRPSDCLVEPLKNEFDDLKHEETKETFVSASNKSRLYKLNNELSIYGFMPLNEIASPAVTSRHIILPVSRETKSAIVAPENAPIEQDITKQPSFCVLLHNGLKQENMVAICIVGRNDETNDDWYGMLHSYVDSKKRSSLMLSMLIPGPNPVLWLPSFKTMGSASLHTDLPQAIRSKITNSRGTLKSYSSNSVIWLDPESVQSDVQKIVRHAKRSPDKAPQFYKELNRIRRAAISYGFYDVLFGLAAILEREKTVIMSDQSKGVNQETLIHIDHVVESLRKSLNEGSYDTNITPPSVEALKGSNNH